MPNTGSMAYRRYQGPERQKEFMIIGEPIERKHIRVA